jgi:hypothetical protein
MVYFMVYTTHYHMVDLGHGANHVRRDPWPRLAAKAILWSCHSLEKILWI